MMCRPVFPVGAAVGYSYRGVGRPASWRSRSQSPGRFVFECSDVEGGEAGAAGVMVRGFRGNQDRTRCQRRLNRLLITNSMDRPMVVRRYLPSMPSRSAGGHVATWSLLATER